MIWFTSDTHYGHENVIQHCNRPFSNAAEMQEVLLENFNSKVKKNDDVYFLGDLTLGKYDFAISILKQMNGRIHIVRGNHDHWSRKQKEYPVVWIKDYYELKHDNQLFVLSHYPFLRWNKSHYGSYHLHGHCHNNLPQEGNRFDVGVDANNFYPISIKDILG